MIEEVDDWVLRVDSLYEDVRNWLQGVRPDLQFEQDRAVTLYEQTMQQFAVPERDISILDVLEKGEVVLTFLPRGLWWFRAWGRVDIIARERTEVLLAVGGPGNPDWQLVLAGTPQRRVPFDREALLAIVSQP